MGNLKRDFSELEDIVLKGFCKSPSIPLIALAVPGETLVDDGKRNVVSATCPGNTAGMKNKQMKKQRKNLIKGGNFMIQSDIKCK